MNSKLIEKYNLIKKYSLFPSGIIQDKFDRTGVNGPPWRLSDNWVYFDEQTMYEDFEFIEVMMPENSFDYLSMEYLHKFTLFSTVFKDLLEDLDDESKREVIDFYLTDYLVGTVLYDFKDHAEFYEAFDDFDYSHSPSEEVINKIESLYKSQDFLDQLEDIIIEIARHKVIHNETTEIEVDGINRNIVYYRTDYENDFAMFLGEDLEFYSVNLNEDGIATDIKKLSFDAFNTESETKDDVLTFHKNESVNNLSEIDESKLFEVITKAELAPIVEVFGSIFKDDLKYELNLRDDTIFPTDRNKMFRRTAIFIYELASGIDLKEIVAYGLDFNSVSKISTPKEVEGEFAKHIAGQVSVERDKEHSLQSLQYSTQHIDINLDVNISYDKNLENTKLKILDISEPFEYSNNEIGLCLITFELDFSDLNTDEPSIDFNNLLTAMDEEESIKFIYELASQSPSLLIQYIDETNYYNDTNSSILYIEPYEELRPPIVSTILSDNIYSFWNLLRIGASVNLNVTNDINIFEYLVSELKYKYLNLIPMNQDIDYEQYSEKYNPYRVIYDIFSVERDYESAMVYRFLNSYLCGGDNEKFSKKVLQIE